MSRAITNKLIHAPTAGLKQASVNGRQDLINSARKLLGLETESAEPGAERATQEQEGQTELELPSTAVETTPTYLAMKATLLSKLETLTDRHEEVSALLGDSQTIADQNKFRDLSREYAELEPVVACYAQYKRVKSRSGRSAADAGRRRSGGARDGPGGAAECR